MFQSILESLRETFISENDAGVFTTEEGLIFD
jgi:hypothetical protein